MEEEDRYSQLLLIVRPYLPEDVSPEQVNRNSHFLNELNINSANLVDIALDVEDQYGITLENEDMEAMKTVEDALQIIDRKLRV